jgi:signal transduction histidine kinase
VTRILLVEDNRGDARLFEELVSEIPGRPFAVEIAGTLSEARARAAACDIVFLDLSLPDAHGVETVTTMAAAARTVPIVVLTGTDDSRVWEEAMRAGAQDYLTKAEITPSLVERTVRYARQRKRAEEDTQRLAIADQAARRAGFLSTLGAAIASSLDLAVMLPAVAKLLVPILGDACTIALAGGTVATAGASDGARSYETQLVARGRVVGSITCALGDRELGEDLQRLAGEAADRIAIGIDNAMLYATAQQAVRARDELMAVVSHDLRNPIGVVALALNMIEDDPAMVPAALPRGKRAVERMIHLIDDLLEIARIENGTLKIEPQPVPANLILEDALEQHGALAKQRGITLELASSTEAIANVDRQRVGQALANLVGNSLKFTPAGGRIKLGARAEANQVVLSVEDTGKGIDREYLGHIFDRFWQPPNAAREGIGLGLAIVKGIVDAHGGQISVESTPGVGTAFQIALPGDYSMS